MPVAPTYPGVYIEEIPSGVHTITGVSTSVTAFVGYTGRGVVDEPVHIFSFADFERAFGGLSTDSPLSYCVRDFFQNGGTEAYVVRTALGAASASVTLRNTAAPVAGTEVLVVSAISAGVWGNNLQIDVDYDTVNPSSLFNLRVIEFEQRNGAMVPVANETFRNLSMSAADPGFVLTAVNPVSQLISVALAPGLVVVAAANQGATSVSGSLSGLELAQLDANHNHIAVRVNGMGPYDITFPVPNLANGVAPALTQLATDLTTAINAQAGAGAVTVSAANGVLTIRSNDVSERSSIQVFNASTGNAARILRVGMANGGRETDVAATFRPLQTGTVGTPTAASATSGQIAAGNLTIANPASRLGVSINGGAPFEITLAPVNNAAVSLATLRSIGEDIADRINVALGATVVRDSSTAQTIGVTSVDPVRCWSIHFSAAAPATNDVSGSLLLGGANGVNDVPAASSSTGGVGLANDAAVAALALASGQRDRFRIGVNGQEPFDVTIPAAAFPIATVAQLTAAGAPIAALINNRLGPNAVTVSVVTANNLSRLVIQSNDPVRYSAIHVTSADTRDVAATLGLGLANGGTEDASLTIDVNHGATAGLLRRIRIPLWAYWSSEKSTPQPRSLDEVAADVDQAMKTLANNEPYLVGASAARVGNALRILPGVTDPNDVNTSFTISGGVAAVLGLTANGARNVARYAPGAGQTALAQVAGATGADGTAPTAAQLRGNELAKTGIYALEDVDIFNLLVMPDATTGGGMVGVLTEAIAYCTRRRAFMIIDAPEQVSTFAQAQAWIGNAASPLRSRNDALYFPRLREPDPLMNGAVRTLPAAGALAGIYARTDAERGVWKAPAGTSATVVGATGLSYTLTDGENGTLNPKGLNCLRTFPVIGTVAWGARTGNGADALADEYKYIPVRRLALFLEESLYRGTQWAVFEPNDEPLWAQIRLNLGAFMHTLYAQGAFQGQTPRDAYFVKCDKETTTQNDIDLGRVNIVVGFAPLKPAEFVIIQIQQIAGAIKT